MYHWENETKEMQVQYIIIPVATIVQIEASLGEMLQKYVIKGSPCFYKLLSDVKTLFSQEIFIAW